MKSFLFFLFLCLVSSLLVAQRLTYDLSEDDLILLMGSYKENNPSRLIYAETNFSWGKQIDGIDDGLIIDYIPHYFEKIKSIYKDYLTIQVAGFFVILDVKKIDGRKFVLKLLDLGTYKYPVDGGEVTITFVDRNHIIVDGSRMKNTCLSFGDSTILWKIAGPDIIQNKIKKDKNGKYSFIGVP
jgi:hypothetical protein